jgi:hypothetical protein
MTFSSYDLNWKEKKQQHRVDSLVDVHVDVEVEVKDEHLFLLVLPLGVATKVVAVKKEVKVGVKKLFLPLLVLYVLVFFFLVFSELVGRLQCSYDLAYVPFVLLAPHAQAQEQVVQQQRQEEMELHFLLEEFFSV